MAVLNFLTLLAQQSVQQSPLRYFAEEFQQRGSRIDPDAFMRGLGLLLALLIAGWLLARLLPWRWMPWSANSPLALFWSLCRVHRLSWADRWLLWQIAKRQRLRQPASLFLEPERIEPAATAWLSPLQASRLESLAWRLFRDESEPVQTGQEGHLRAAATAPPRSDSAESRSAAAGHAPTSALETPTWPPVDAALDDLGRADGGTPPGVRPTADQRPL